METGYDYHKKIFDTCEAMMRLVGQVNIQIFRLREFEYNQKLMSKGTPPIEKIDFFRALPEKGGGGGPCPNLLTLFSTMLSLIF